MVRPVGFEPTTIGFEDRYSSSWATSAWRDYSKKSWVAKFFAFFFSQVYSIHWKMTNYRLYVSERIIPSFCILLFVFCTFFSMKKLSLLAPLALISLALTSCGMIRGVDTACKIDTDCKDTEMCYFKPEGTVGSCSIKPLDPSTDTPDAVTPGENTVTPKPTPGKFPTTPSDIPKQEASTEDLTKELDAFVDDITKGF